MPDKNLDDRVTTLEQQVARLRKDTRRENKETRTLATGAHEDVGTVKAKLAGNERTLNALRDNQLEFRKTQLEHGQRLDRLESKVDLGFAQADRSFAQINENFRVVEQKFGVVNTGIAHITELLTGREDTKPSTKDKLMGKEGEA